MAQTAADRLTWKAGRVVSRRNLDRLRSIYAALKDILDNARLDADALAPPDQAADTAKHITFLHKGKDGLRFVGLITSNAYVDRDREIVSFKALHDWVETAWQGGQYVADNPLLFWHDGPPIGDVIWSDMRGPFLVEIAKERRTPFAKLIFDLVEQLPISWGVSQGFRDKGHNYIGRRKVYRRIAKKETSILPLAFAANAFTQVEVTKMGNKLRLNFLQRHAPEAAHLEKRLTRSARNKQSSLDKAGIARKQRQTGNRTTNKRNEKGRKQTTSRRAAPDEDEDELEDEDFEDEEDTEVVKALDVQTLTDGLISMIEELLTEAGAEVPDDLEERIAALLDAATSTDSADAGDGGDNADQQAARETKQSQAALRLQRKQVQLLETLMEDLEVVDELADEVKALKPVAGLPKQVKALQQRLMRVEKKLSGGPRAASDEDESEVDDEDIDEEDEKDLQEFKRGIQRQKNKGRAEGMFGDLYEQDDDDEDE
jgi:hypothetical protein